MKKVYVYTDFFVGQVFPETIGRNDCNQFDITNGGAVLFMTVKSPTTHEIEQFSSKNRSIRMTCFPDCLWMTFKFGDLEWNEAPYTPHLSKGATFPPAIHTACDHISIVLIDSVDGKVKYCDTVGLSPELTAALKTGISMLLPLDFNREEYDALLDYVQMHYSTKQIADNAIVESSL